MVDDRMINKSMALCSVTNKILNVSGGVVRALANLGRLELLIAGVACMTALAGADTIADGNFSSVTGFGSDYTNAGPTCSPGSVGAGKYFVGSIPTACNPLWESISPYNGESNMMIVNGGGDETSRVWYETLSTTPNTQYTFTFWVADLDTPSVNMSPETLEFTVNSVVIAGCSDYSPNTPGVWVQETCTYTSGASTSETLALLDANTAWNSNDFALDDISDPDPPNCPARTSAVPEPNSLAVLASGLMAILLVSFATRQQF
jgi:hypothetical protein